MFPHPGTVTICLPSVFNSSLSVRRRPRYHTRPRQERVHTSDGTRTLAGRRIENGIDALYRVGLTERDHRPKELSGGEQQRVAIARALINEPKILFADEQTANQDSVSSRQILELFRKMFRDMGQTILMVMHELEDEDIVDKVIWLADGEVVEREV